MHNWRLYSKQHVRTALYSSTTTSTAALRSTELFSVPYVLVQYSYEYYLELRTSRIPTTIVRYIVLLPLL